MYTKELKNYSGSSDNGTDSNVKFKPVIFVDGHLSFYRPNYYAQNILLKAMQDGVTSIQELKKISGLKTAADVYRTLDKLAIRREYHESLARNGISLDYIVQGIKKIADFADSDATRLKGYLSFMRSLGLETYDKEEISSTDWEEEVIKVMEEKRMRKEGAITGEVVVSKVEEDKDDEIEEYEVTPPELVKLGKGDEEKISKMEESLYE